MVGRRFVVLGALAIAYGAVASVQCHAWRNDHAFVAHVRELAPGDPSVHVLAGGLALRAGDAAGLRQARNDYRTALDLWPQRTDAFAKRQRAAALAGLAWCDFTDPDSCVHRVGPTLIGRFRAALAR